MYDAATQNRLGLMQVSKKDSKSNLTSSYRGTEKYGALILWEPGKLLTIFNCWEELEMNIMILHSGKESCYR